MTKTAVKEHGNRTHGMSRTRFYKAYHNMRERCENESRADYANYGGRGISMCERWETSFDNFYADMHDAYSAHVSEHGAENTSIDRIDGDGNYELRNCRWATPSQQTHNRRMHSTNTSGFTGVHWNRDANKWRVMISGKHIGYFESKETAVKTRQAYQAQQYGTVELNGAPYDLERLVSGFYAEQPDDDR